MSTDAEPFIAQRQVSKAELALLPESLHPVLRRVYAARKVGMDELNPVLARLIPVGTLSGAVTAARLLADALEARQRIVVLGDFDADGATAAALAVSCLRRMGYFDVRYLVPDRFRFGYGLSPEIALLAAQDTPDILITVDNGISSVAGVQRANDLGMQVIVTDHHLPGRELPAAACIVNPNLPDEAFASKNLAGVGVAFYVMAALGRELASRQLIDAKRASAVVADTIDLVALGTVADLVPLDFNNRILVAEGLRRIRAGKTRPGIEALFSVAARDARAAGSADLGFAIAPRLNAAGRLTDMSLGIECLLATESGPAISAARKLDALNVERRELQARMESEARDCVDRMRTELAADANGYCLFDEQWHEGIVGLVASRIKDAVGRPVFAFAPAAEDGLLKGSARSIDGIHIRDVIDAVATRNPGLVLGFGGHAMAAGLSLGADRLDEFRSAVDAELGAWRDALERPDVIWTDGELAAGDLSLDFAQELGRGGPWGQRFPEPVFSNAVEIIETRLLKDRHLKMRVRVPGDSQIIDAIAFNQTDIPGADQSGRVRFVYRLQVNEFRERLSQQLVVQHMQSD